MPSPFPGMDPYLEDPGLWPDVHSTLIAVAREFLAQQLRPKYTVRIEDRVYVSGQDDPGRDAIIPDIRVSETAKRKRGKVLVALGEPPAMTQPEVIPTLIDDEIHEARLEIVQRQG